ncbi:MAG: aminotransferase class V-fold PLP-dependent enzyme, partial [Burkholderiales bacterium]
LHQLLLEAIPDLKLNGHASERLPNTLNVSFPRASGRDLLLAAEEQVAASVGSACHSESDSVSGVLAAMGLSTRQAIGAVRLSVGRYSTEDEIAQAAQALIAGWKRVRMVQGAVQEL